MARGRYPVGLQTAKETGKQPSDGAREGVRPPSGVVILRA
jgi:hypothetical protein